MDLDHRLLTELFGAVGEELRLADARIAILVVGGVCIGFRGIQNRTTRDVDVIALVVGDPPHCELIPPDPIPEPLLSAVSRVARDYELQPDWLNTVVGKQWAGGLPPGILDDVGWLEFGGLRVALAGRIGLIPLKLFAAIDQGPTSVHWRDLLAVRPDQQELDLATKWVRTQDVGSEFQTFVSDAVERLQAILGSR